MNRTPVKSSNIKSVGHDPASNTLEVEFLNGGVHQYFGVWADKYQRMLSAPSVGKYFHRFVKGVHHSKEMPAPRRGQQERKT